jgi:hypothetical protein
VHLFAPTVIALAQRRRLLGGALAAGDAQGFAPCDGAYPWRRPLGRAAVVGVSPGAQGGLLGGVVGALVAEDRAGLAERQGAERRPVPVGSRWMEVCLR